MDELHANRGPQVVALRWGLLAFVLLTLTLRLACRKISKQSIWWDDYLALIGMVSLKDCRLLMPHAHNMC